MRNMNKLTKLSAGISVAYILLIILSASLVSALGIGVSPSEYKIKNAMRGGEYFSSITIYNPDDISNNFTLRAEYEAGSWISFYEDDVKKTTINEITVDPRGTRPVYIKIKIPEEEASGVYNATIFVETIPGGSQNESITTRLQAEVIISVNVTGDQVINGTVNSITLTDVESGALLKIKTMFQNTGNVVVKPKIEIIILQDNNTITSLIHESTRVTPTVNEPIVVEWNTTSKGLPGKYEAKVVVTLNGIILKSEIRSFKILPVGTYTRKGNLTTLDIEGEPAVDKLTKVRAIFKNTGEIETPAKFTAEVYKDGELIDTISSEEMNIPINREILLISYLKITSPGQYLIKGKVIYSGKETPVQEYSFKAGKRSTPGFEVISASIAFLALMLLGLIRRKN